MTPALVFNETTATGWLRCELFGDRELARAHVYDARTVLGTMRSIQGVNERIAQGQPGGFYHQWQTLPDGAVIHAISNDGHDTIRVYAGAERPVKRPSPEPQPEATSNYLWVGVRIKWAGSDLYDSGPAVGMPWNALLAMMAEPAGEGGGPNGLLLAGVQAGWYERVYVDYSDANAPAKNFAGNPTTMSEMVQDMWNHWNGVAPFHKFHDFPLGWHCFQLRDSAGSPDNLFFSRNGMLAHDWGWCDVATDADKALPPYDPSLAADNQQGERDWGSARTAVEAVVQGSNGYPCMRAWDIVYVVDPDTTLDPTDGRGVLDTVNTALERAGMASGLSKVLSGQYLLNIGAYGDNQVYSTRNGETVPTLDPSWKRSGPYDFSEYRTLSHFTPMTVEVEVRIGKAPATQTFNFEVRLDRFSASNRNSFPFGTTPSVGSTCQDDSGPNTMANWHPKSIAIDIEAQTADFSDALPEGVFQPAAHSIEELAALRYPVEIYVFEGYGVSRVADVDYPDYAATAVAQLLDEMTTGYWGANCEIRQRLYPDILAAAGGLHTGSVWLYNVQRNEFSELPIVSTDTDYTYGGSSSYLQRFFWWYPYRVIAKNRCSKVFAINLAAAKTFEAIHGQQTYSDEAPDLWNLAICCPEYFFD